MRFLFSKKDEGNKELVEQIILERYNQYYRLAYSYVHNEADASDIVQNGAYKAIKNSHTLNKPEFAGTWVYRIMLNECFRCLRQPKLISYEDIQDEKGTEAGYKEDSYANVDLLRAMDELPVKDKAIVILRYFEDKKLEEIADILEENVNTVKSRLYRSMKKLRDRLSDDSDGSGCSLNDEMG